MNGYDLTALAVIGATIIILAIIAGAVALAIVKAKQQR